MGLGEASIISISADGASFLAAQVGVVLEEGRAAPPEVVRVGFHADLKLPIPSPSTPPNFEETPHVDIVFLELDRKPSLPDDTYVIPEIKPVTASTEARSEIKGNVVGTALSGQVAGKGLQYDKNDGIFIFLVDFSEKGTSGTIMYAKIGDRLVALGCFKGTEGAIENKHPRGRIVPLPEWGKVDWFRCEKQLRPYRGTIILNSETQFAGPAEKWGCTTYLTMERCKSYSFLPKGGKSFGGEHDDEGEY